MWVLGLVHRFGLFTYQKSHPERKPAIWFSVAGTALVPLALVFFLRYFSLVPRDAGIAAFVVGCLVLTPLAVRFIWRCAEGRDIKSVKTKRLEGHISKRA